MTEPLQGQVAEVLQSGLVRQSAARRGKQPRDPATGRILKHEVTPDTVRQVQQAAALGLPRRQIAALVGIDEDTLKKHYDAHMLPAEARANLQVASQLFKSASSGQDTTAAIYWTKARMGWRDRDDGAAQVNVPMLNIQINL